MHHNYQPNWNTRAKRRIHISDNDIGTCQALSVFLRLEGYPTESFTTSEAFLVANASRQPDVAILNMSLEGRNSLDLIGQLRTSLPTLGLFLLCDTPDVETVVRAMSIGVQGAFVKPFNTGLILELLGRFFNRNANMNAILAHLTPRERQVLNLIVNGSSSKQAGEELGISPRTVEVHRARVMGKLGAKNTVELMRIILK